MIITANLKIKMCSDLLKISTAIGYIYPPPEQITYSNLKITQNDQICLQYSQQTWKYQVSGFFHSAPENIRVYLRSSNQVLISCTDILQSDTFFPAYRRSRVRISNM